MNTEIKVCFLFTNNHKIRLSYLITLTLLVYFFSMWFTAPTFAADYKMGTGGKKGSYYAMGSDIVNYCKPVFEADGNTITLVESPNGSVENLTKLSEKGLAMGMSQEDVMRFFSKRDPQNFNSARMKIIAGLHIEIGNLLIPKDFTPTVHKSVTDRLKFWKSDTKGPIDIQLLSGQTVGAWGGSLESLKALNFYMKLNMNMVEIPEKERGNPGKPVLIVGGQAYKPVQDILDTGKYILAPIDAEQLRQEAPFYIQMTSRYTIEGKVQQVKTFGVRAYLYGKSFINTSKNAPMEKLAQCISDSLPDLADDTGTNPNWTSVYELQQKGATTDWDSFTVK